MAESKRRDGPMVVRNSPGAVVRRSTEPSGSPSSALSFLERSNRSESSSLPATWPAGFVPPSKTDRDRDRAAHASSTHIPRLPRTSALAFLERPPIGGGGTSTNSIVTGAGAEAGLGSLSGGVMATGSGRGGFLPRAHSSIGGSGSEDSDELDELDSDICPSMLFSCFPCLSWFRWGATVWIMCFVFAPFGDVSDRGVGWSALWWYAELLIWPTLVTTDTVQFQLQLHQAYRCKSTGFRKVRE